LVVQVQVKSYRYRKVMEGRANQRYIACKHREPVVEVSYTKSVLGMTDRDYDGGEAASARVVSKGFKAFPA
jgi:hypothetical protein